MGGRGWERNIDVRHTDWLPPATQVRALDWASNPWPFSVWADTNYWARGQGSPSWFPIPLLSPPLNCPYIYLSPSPASSSWGWDSGSNCKRLAGIRHLPILPVLTDWLQSLTMPSLLWPEAQKASLRPGSLVVIAVYIILLQAAQTKVNRSHWTQRTPYAFPGFFR